MLTIEIPYWKSHHNQLLYSALVYTQRHRIPLRIQAAASVPNNCALLHWKGKWALLDYDDTVDLHHLPMGVDLYAKRSLLPTTIKKGVIPLNFQVNFAHQPWALMRNMQTQLLIDKNSRIEVARAMDLGAWLTNDAHCSKTLKAFELAQSTAKKPRQLLYLTRLWDPSRHPDPAEKARRQAMNAFRIATCEQLRKAFPLAITGLYPDAFAQQQAPSLVVDAKMMRKAHYMRLLQQSVIGIADDGLGDTPGWKIGEYVMAGMAIVSTPIRTVAENFQPLTHYMPCQHRGDTEGIVAAVAALLQHDQYQQMQENNRRWYRQYLAPVAYIQRILDALN